MRTISNEIIEAMPIDLINEFRTKAISLMSGLMEEMEMRFDSLTTEEINFFKVPKWIGQSILLKFCVHSRPRRMSLPPDLSWFCTLD